MPVNAYKHVYFGTNHHCCSDSKRFPNHNSDILKGNHNTSCHRLNLVTGDENIKKIRM